MVDAQIERRALLDELASSRSAEDPHQDPSASAKSGGVRRYLIAITLFGAIVGLIAWQIVPEQQLASAPQTAETAETEPEPVLQATTDVAPAAPPPPSSISNIVLDATGYVVARRQAAVSSKITGKVAEILIEEGMLVEEGQLLARLDDLIPRAEYDLAIAELEGTKLVVNELRISHAQARRELKRVETLAESEFASRAMLERAETKVAELRAQISSARQNTTMAERRAAVRAQVLADTEIRSPFTGIVTTKSAQPGEMISPVSAGGGFTRTGICTIVDMDSLEVEVDVNEAFIDRVYSAQPVDVVLNAYPDHPFPAQVTAIIPAADRNKATIRIRIGFLERDARVLPGMGVRVSFKTEPIN
jgi:RND family efflux transporter MFP subunit